ncbi:MAG: polysaccharide pyruvyl transferase family protein [Bacteroidales bacterium]|nr:polysaccharide pyruvyl transferase family protein [Bacteroidales bacterium]
MSKKVGIITIVEVNNFGAELQAFATQNALQRLGYDAEIIDYPFYKNPRHKATQRSRPEFPIPINKRLAEWLYPKMARAKQFLHGNRLDEKRNERYAKFHHDNTRFSPEYPTIESLYAAKMDYDAYVVGSDQVWNPFNYSSLDPYFLRFAPTNKRKLSYASSFGVSTLPEYTRDYYHEALLGLDAISVREENALQMVKDVSGKKAQWVLDPTLLLTGKEWMQFATAVDDVPEKYVLIYEVTPCSYLKEFAVTVANELGLKIVRINREAVRQEEDEEVLNVMDAGPAEFIWLFGHASVILTNSFHGTAFSLIFNKAFYVVTPARKRNNSRQESLLRMVGLEDRLIVEGAPMPNLKMISVDYSRVNSLLDAQREKSISFLRNAIDGE